MIMCFHNAPVKMRKALTQRVMLKSRKNVNFDRFDHGNEKNEMELTEN